MFLLYIFLNIEFTIFLQATCVQKQKTNWTALEPSSVKTVHNITLAYPAAQLVWESCRSVCDEHCTLISRWVYEWKHEFTIPHFSNFKILEHIYIQVNNREVLRRRRIMIVEEDAVSYLDNYA